MAGVGQRSIKWHAIDLFNLFSLDESNYPFLNKKEIVLGVVNKEGKPNAIIHFVEGHMERAPKRVKNASRVRSQKPGFVRERA